jgi:hypothetical protein
MAAAPPARRKLRILCLHSWRTSGAIFREQVQWPVGMPRASQARQADGSFVTTMAPAAC